MNSDTRSRVSAKPRKRRKKAGKPDKPYPEFPLFAHAATRRWAKKIRGQLHYFGPWDKPQEALQRYLDQKDDLFAGRKPRPQDGRLTVEDLVNKFLAFKKGLADSGDRSESVARFADGVGHEQPDGGDVAFLRLDQQGRLDILDVLRRDRGEQRGAKDCHLVGKVTGIVEGSWV
jgi:hypothetical protein